MRRGVKKYASAETWKLEQVGETLARLQNGMLHTIPGQHVVGECLAKEWMTQEGLDEARKQYGASA